ncbi:MAG TPA: hypothetical protein VLN26_13335 [Gaiellaceae bacterium]|nr:hypothetical protein [Gaiellaceae bacterium]
MGALTWIGIGLAAWTAASVVAGLVLGHLLARGVWGFAPAAARAAQPSEAWRLAA